MSGTVHPPRMYTFSCTMTPATEDLGVGMLGPLIQDDVGCELGVDEEKQNCEVARNRQKDSTVMKIAVVNETPVGFNK
jgi:hypothetical protein